MRKLGMTTRLTPHLHWFIVSLEYFSLVESVKPQGLGKFAKMSIISLSYAVGRPCPGRGTSFDRSDSGGAGSLYDGRDWLTKDPGNEGRLDP